MNQNRFHAVPRQRIVGRFIRVIHEDYIDGGPLNVEGAKHRDGRFHKRGVWPALYLSEDRETGKKEVERWALGEIELDNFLAFAVDVDLQTVADLTSEGTLALLGIVADWLLAVDHEACQELASGLRDAGFEAIVYWSAANPGHKNLVVFPDRLTEGSSFTNSGVVLSK